MQLLTENDVTAYLSPRQQICSPDTKFTSAATGQKIATDGTMCVSMIDTDQEKEIGVGVSWPFEKLGPKECIISKEFEA